MRPGSRTSSRTSSRVSFVPLLSLFLLLLAPLFPDGAPLQGQSIREGITLQPELRWGATAYLQGPQELRTATGDGWGVRIFGYRGVGIGLESDRAHRSRTVGREVCEGPDNSSCFFEEARLRSTMDITSLMVLLDAGATDELRFRFGLARQAGVITGEGEGLETGESFTPPPADLGASTLAWSRGADGSALLIEVHWSPELPGPFRLGAMAGFRQSSVMMEGCGGGTYSPYCGRMNQTSFMLGARLSARLLDLSEG